MCCPRRENYIKTPNKTLAHSKSLWGILNQKNIKGIFLQKMCQNIPAYCAVPHVQLQDSNPSPSSRWNWPSINVPNWHLIRRPGGPGATQ